MPVRFRWSALAAAALLALGLPRTARAQGELVELRFDGPGSQWVEGVLRCRVGEEAQLALQGLDADGNRVPMEKYAPKAASANPRVVSAVVPTYSANVLNLVCRGDGETRITVTAGHVSAAFPAMAGTMRDAQPTVGTTTATATTAPTATSPQAVTGTATPTFVTVTATPTPPAPKTPLEVAAPPITGSGLVFPAPVLTVSAPALVGSGLQFPAPVLTVQAPSISGSGVVLFQKRLSGE
jgi:hypothetical protein